MVTVRVVSNRSNKRKFEERDVKDFPKYRSMFGHELKAEHQIKKIDVGYIGYSNRKYEITCDEAYETYDDSSKSPVFFMVEADDKTTSTGSDLGARLNYVGQITYAKIKQSVIIFS